MKVLLGEFQSFPLFSLKGGSKFCAFIDTIRLDHGSRVSRID